MASLRWFYVCVVLVTFVADSSLGCRRSSQNPTPDPLVRDLPASVYQCGICGQPITVTLILRNHFKEPFVEYQVTISGQPQRELIHFLEVAATKDPHFKFSADHYGSMGYMVTSLGGIMASASEMTYWSIHEYPSENSLAMGVSSYVPINDQTVLFNFTTYATTHS